MTRVDSARQISPGERAALEGILARGGRRRALVVGAADPGDLALVARHCREVHCCERIEPPDTAARWAGATFQTGEPPDTAARWAGATFQTGEPPAPLASFLAELAGGGRDVDFVLLDGTAAAAGLRATLEQLLDSPALVRTAIVIQQTTVERVRRELDAVRFAAWPKVVSVDPDFVPGRLLAQAPRRHELRGGLGLVLIDAAARRYHAGPILDQSSYPAAGLLAEVRDYVIARERTAGPGAAYAGEPLDPAQTRVIELLREELAHAEHEIRRLRSVALHHEALWRSMMDSWSWRLTSPIRTIKGSLAGARGNDRGRESG